MRTIEQLQALLSDFKGWFKNEFGQDYSYPFIEHTLSKMVEERVLYFLKKRIGHLSDTDFLNFREVLKEKKIEEVISSGRPKKTS